MCIAHRMRRFVTGPKEIDASRVSHDLKVLCAACVFSQVLESDNRQVIAVLRSSCNNLVSCFRAFMLITYNACQLRLQRLQEKEPLGRLQKALCVHQRCQKDKCAFNVMLPQLPFSSQRDLS